MIPLLEQAAGCPDYSPELDYTVPSAEFLTQTTGLASKHRSAVRLLSCRAELLALNGRGDEAVQTALCMLRLAHQVDRVPFLMSYLVAMAVRSIAVQSANVALQTTSVSKGVRNALDVELAAHERIEGFRWIINTERAFVRKSFIDSMPGRNFWLFGRGFWNRQESACLEVFPALIAAAGPPVSYSSAEQAIKAPKAILAELLFPAFRSAFASAANTQARIRCMRVLNAIQTHVPADSNEVPKLGELGLPAETTIDPFNGEPLHVKKLPEGWLVYSVGRNLRDDGGKLDDADSDVGVSPFRPSVQPAEENGAPTEK
jgi:hypothetical protein